jgi:hypothetical protein
MKGKVLLGWLTRQEAVRYLQNDCIFDPPLTTEQAAALWAEKKAVVDALEPRTAPSPTTLEMTASEREAANKFLAFHRRKPGGLGGIREVIKTDPSGLVLRQFDITIDRANEHAAHIQSPNWCALNCLATERVTPNLNFAAVPNGWNFGLPHGEFLLAFNGQAFGIVVGAPHISVSPIGERSILWAGYHRCYARASNVNPATNDRSVLAALTNEGTLAVGPGATNQTPLRDLVLGDRPPLFGDFFDERLFIEVELQHKRYELQIRVEVARLNVP